LARVAAVEARTATGGLDAETRRAGPAAPRSFEAAQRSQQGLLPYLLNLHNLDVIFGRLAMM